MEVLSIWEFFGLSLMIFSHFKLAGNYAAKLDFITVLHFFSIFCTSVINITVSLLATTGN